MFFAPKTKKCLDIELCEKVSLMLICLEGLKTNMNQQNIQTTKVKSVATPPSEQEPDSAIKSIHSDTCAPSISKFCLLQEPGPTSLRSPGVDRCLSGELGGSPFESQILPDPSESHADPLLRTSAACATSCYIKTGQATSKIFKISKLDLKTGMTRAYHHVEPEYPTCSKTLS